MIFIVALKEVLSEYGINTSTLRTTTDGRALYHAELTEILTDASKLGMFNDSNVVALTESEWKELIPVEEVL
jgi:hypothetical protein